MMNMFKVLTEVLDNLNNSLKKLQQVREVQEKTLEQQKNNLIKLRDIQSKLDKVNSRACPPGHQAQVISLNRYKNNQLN